MRALFRSRVGQVLLGVLGVTVLLAVLSLYLRPAFLLTLADQLWSCF